MRIGVWAVDVEVPEAHRLKSLDIGEERAVPFADVLLERVRAHGPRFHRLDERQCLLFAVRGTGSGVDDAAHACGMRRREHRHGSADVHAVRFHRMLYGILHARQRRRMEDHFRPAAYFLHELGIQDGALMVYGGFDDAVRESPA